MPDAARVVKFRLTPQAQQQLDRIWDHIAQDSPRAADGVIWKIQGKIELAAGSPAIGSPRSEIKAKARALVAGAYLVLYEPDPEGILIVAVVHAMTDTQSWL